MFPTDANVFDISPRWYTIFLFPPFDAMNRTFDCPSLSMACPLADVYFFPAFEPGDGLILILPVGFQLSVMSGLIELYAWALGLIWLFSLIWLAVMWAGHLQHHSGSRGHLRRIDMWFRYTAIISMAALGTLSLTTNEPFLASWLSLKAVLFATVVAIGMYLRTIISAWGLGFEKLMRDDECEEGNCLIASAGRKGTLGALLLWALLFAISFLGVIKPL